MKQTFEESVKFSDATWVLIIMG